MRAGLYGMSRFTWADLMPSNARQSMTELAHALEQSQRLYARPEQVIAS
jgi:hypothetical protein